VNGKTNLNNKSEKEKTCAKMWKNGPNECGLILASFYVRKKYRISRPIRRSVIFSLEILEKNNDVCILILVIYWKKTGLLHTKISNHNIIYSSQKPRKLPLPLKSSTWLFSLSDDKDVV